MWDCRYLSNIVEGESEYYGQVQVAFEASELIFLKDSTLIKARHHGLLLYQFCLLPPYYWKIQMLV